tara:strand:+ start:8345 stop:8908 length:564 start_codon:yes stop_codon:yes gene_type:complete
MTPILRIDPGSPSAWALYDDRALKPDRYSYGLVKMKGETPQELYETMKTALDDVSRQHGLNMVRRVNFAVEDQFEKTYEKKDGTKGSNFRSVKTLVENRRTWECAAMEVFGARLDLQPPVHPATWQAMLGCPRGTKSAELVSESITYAKSIVGLAVTEHEAAAVCMVELAKTEASGLGEMRRGRGGS